MYLLELGILLLLSLAAQGEESPGCSVDGKTFKVGEHNPIPNSCVGNICSEDGSFGMVSCGQVRLPHKWTYIPDDPSKSYPDCCGHGVPPLDVVPDVLDSLSYSDVLDVTFAGGIQVDMGNELTPTQVKSMPKVSYTPDEDSFYLLAMTDPDAPSRQEPAMREFLHWLVGNIPGSNMSKGEVLAEYVGSGPPKDSGLHRYVFLLYRQPRRLSFEEPRVNRSTVTHRPHFRIRELASRYGLGDPVALNLYQARYDDYVPILHKQLGFGAA